MLIFCMDKIICGKASINDNDQDLKFSLPVSIFVVIRNPDDAVNTAFSQGLDADFSFDLTPLELNKYTLQ